ncbi:hypothetical protein B9G98_00912 [Wickerhamiella sorbophila]|uniref:FIST domain-containing protein n=1 Tax=Wickerhamiella sorbophila TaxID=45607 RepID=A0A2T0FE64_9ASCO|nr:hypothetical protein B9G98_00912 [Wickerhamiella sorbophila]PRT53292.1 hypothetical protein B9G98_00912 [Wickerhamiella sorbophila]
MGIRGTIANPKHKLVDYLAQHAANKLTKSVLVVGTPQYADQLTSLSKDLSGIQTVAAAVDTVPFGNQRNGFSWAVFDKPIQIQDRISLKSVESTDTKWSASTAALSFSAAAGSAGPGAEVSMAAANTLFSNGLSATMFDSDSTEPLAGLKFELPEKLMAVGGVRPIEPISDWLTITSVTDNMLKTLNDTAAASYLENAEALKNADDVDTFLVFAEINSATGRPPQFIKIIAGGGGLWSARSRMLVLEPPASPSVGDQLRFHLANSRKLSEPALKSLHSHYETYEQHEGVVLETALVEEELDQKPLVHAKKNTFWPVFGMGSERGFLVNNVKHAIPGEIMELRDQ